MELRINRVRINCSRPVFPVEICSFGIILLKLLQNYPSQYIDHLPHLRIHFLCISVPKYQQFVTSAHINNSAIEGMTPMEHAVVLQ